VGVDEGDVVRFLENDAPSSETVEPVDVGVDDQRGTTDLLDTVRVNDDRVERPCR